MDIVFCTDDNYAMPCGVAITSILENNKGSLITFHIIGMDLKEDIKTKFLSIPSKYDKASIVFYEIKKELIESYDFSLYDSKHLSLAIYSRLFLTGILPQHIGKLLYLDCDIVVCGSLTELWNTDMENYSIAGVPDLNISRPGSPAFQYLGYDETYQYINSGVLLINLEYWRKHDMTTVFLDFLKEKYDKLLFHDQDILNGTLYNTKLLIPMKYNLLEFYYLRNTNLSQNKEEVYAAMKNPVIIHYTALDKPWIRSCLHPLKGEFLKYKFISLWKNVPLTWAGQSLSKKMRYYKRIALYALKLKKSKYIEIKKDAKTGTYKFTI